MSKEKIDLTGQVFSYLTVLEDDGTRDSNGGVKWKCQCECGKVIHVLGSNLRKGQKSCGCKNAEISRKANFKNITGQRFGKLVVLEYIGKNKNKSSLWRCKCDCGNEKIAPSTTLLRGDCNSCGCLHDKQIKDLTGQIFGKLTALYYIKGKDGKQGKWHCKCECGNECDVFRSNLTRLHTTSCGCQVKSIGEKNIEKLLIKNNIKYLRDSTFFKDLRSKKEKILRYDFIIFEDERPVRIIEFDGRQHYNGAFWYEPSEQREERDDIKNQYAFSHNIPIVRIPYQERDKITLELLFGDKYLLREEEENE